MIRIGITQRVNVVEDYEERRDCLDQRWGPLLRSFGYLPIPLFNRIENVEKYVSDLDLDGVILTGGNDLESVEDGSDVAPERDEFERAVVDVALNRNLPVLGVCRGAQLLNVHFGGAISPVDGHVATPHTISIDEPLIAEVPADVTTNSYHNYGISKSDLAEGLQAVGRAPDGTVEWFYHDAYPIRAVMWHPERESLSSDLDRRVIQTHFGSDEQ